MAIYKGNPHNLEEVITWLEKCEALTKKRKENKEKLVNEVVNHLMDNIPHNLDVIRDCLYNDFKKCTQKELKTWL